MSFAPRALSFVFTRQDGSTFPNGATTITLPPGLMAQVRITNAGMPGMGGVQASVWGLTLNVMNQISTMGLKVTRQPKNYVKVIASNADGTNTSTAFFGGIRVCAPDFNRGPDPCLTFQGWAGVEVTALTPLAQGYNGSIDVIKLLQQICEQMGYTLEENGVSGISVTQYSWGDPRTVLAELRAMLVPNGYDLAFDIQDKIVAIWNIQKARGSPGGIPLVSPGTPGAPGTLIGYPTYTELGIDFTCIYTPGLRHAAQVQVKSSLPAAEGLFYIYGIAHNLDSQIPGGKWETRVQASLTNGPLPVAQAGTT